MLSKILFFFSVSFALLSQDFRSKDKVTSIESIISPEQVEALKSEPNRASQVEALLKSYFSKNKTPFIPYNKDFSINEIRLFDLKTSLRNTPSYLIENSPILFQLYTILGNEYQKKKQDKKAIQSFTTALRYRKLKLTEDSYLNEEPLNELLSNQVENIKQHKSLKNNIEKKKKEILDLKLNKYRKEAEVIRNKIDKNQLNNINNLDKKNQLKDELIKLENQYQESYEDNFIRYKNQLEEKGVKLILSLAKLIKKVEIENKKNLDIKNEIIRREKNTIFDFKKNKNNISYKALLELAYRLNDKNKEVLFQLSNELKESGENKKSINYFTRYIEIEDNKESDNYKKALESLAYLYENTHQFIKAAQTYEKYSFLENDFEKIKNISFKLAYLYENKLGSLDKSFYYYEKWLKQISNEEFSLEQSTNEILKQIDALFLFSQYYKKKKKEKEELQYLMRIFNLYENLKDKIADKKRELDNVEKELTLLKKELDKSNSEQYNIKSQYETKEKEKNMINKEFLLSQSVLSSLITKKKFLDRLAEINLKNKNYENARLYYQEIINSDINSNKKNHIINKLQGIKN